MQCSSCGTQLPQGIAYCSTCGSMTPYHVSFSEASPSDPTVASSSAQSSPYPYPSHPEASLSDPTVASSSAQSSPYPYPPPNPYDTPSFTPPPNPYDTPSLIPPPPPPPSHHRRPSVMSMALLIILVLLIVGTGGFLFFRMGPSSGQPQPHASPTTQAQQGSVTPSPTIQATANSSAQTPQDLYAQITQTSPVLDDPLQMNDTNNWTESTSADGSCAFTEGAYHARVQQQNSYMLCMAQATNFSDLAYQVQMTIVKGEFGGMVFRTDSSQAKYYSFFIDSSGTYTLITSVDNTGTRDRVLHKDTSVFIKTGLNQANVLAIVARGNTIYLFINQQYITSASDSTYHDGQIGVFGGDYTQAPADVVFSHIQVWKL